MSRSKRLMIIILVVLLVAAGSTVVYLVDPSVTTWLPKCPLHALTGLDCPSCGSTRALHHILHGEFVKGLSFNPVAPVLWLLGGIVIVLIICFPRHRASSLMRVLVGLYIGVYLLWWIVRNI